MFTNRLASFVQRSTMQRSHAFPLLATQKFSFTEETKAPKAKKAAVRKTATKKNVIEPVKKTNGVYLWTKMPRSFGAAKGGAAIEKLKWPKGMPQRITEYDHLNVQKLRVGLRHNAAISEDGQLYTSGEGQWGVLGHGNEDTVNFKRPKLVEGLSKHNVVDVALGEWHSIALTDDGNVWTWGYGGKKGYFNWMITQEIGALGHGDVEPTFVPRKVNFFEENGLKVEKIAAGNYHCVVTCDDGNLYNWGVGLYGVLGNGTNSYALKPIANDDLIYTKEETENEGLKFGFRKISSADDYTAAILENGELQVWGKNDCGQLGVGAGIGIDMVESENTPKEVDLMACLSSEEQADYPLVTNVSTGLRTMMIVDQKNRLYQTGLKIDWNPKHVKGLNRERIEGKIELLGCGRNHYCFSDSGNNLHTFGTVIGGKAEEQYDGYGIYEGNEIFEGGKMLDLQVKYDNFGVLVEDE